MLETRQLLHAYAADGCEESFGELVSRYINLVYSTALRMVNGDGHMAEDVVQKVFTDLARQARQLPEEVALGGWLHRHTCFVAGNLLRGERRRIHREHVAVEMNYMEDHDAENLRALSPVLDEAINELAPEDQQAIALRFFERQDFRAVGENLGSTEEAARKRVNRALEKLQSLLKRRGVALSVGGLGAFLSTQAISAAPAGLATAATAAALAGVATAGGGAAIGIFQIMSMTKAQAGVIAAVTLALAIPLGLQVQSNSKLQAENERLRQLSAEVSKLKDENKDLSTRLAAARSTPAPNPDQMSELLKLRGEVGVLRKALKEAPAPTPPPAGQSVLGGITSNPEMQKMIRDQQKLGLSMIYRGLAKQADLPEEKVQALNELLADNVMTNINHITQVLKEGKSTAEMEPVFAAQEEALKTQVRELLGPEAYEKYDEYTRSIASYLTAQQFKGMMTGENEEKEEKSRHLFELMKEETRIALENAGLPPDYQTVPTLNFRNIASEQIAEYNLQLLDSIYAKVSARAESFLSPQDVEKFAEFRKMAGDNNRVALTVNRKVMMPGAE